MPKNLSDIDKHYTSYKAEIPFLKEVGLVDGHE